MMGLSNQERTSQSKNSRLLSKATKGVRGFTKFACYVMGETGCGVWTGLDIWRISILVSKASKMSIGVMKKRCQWTQNVKMINNKTLVQLYSRINWRTPCALNVSNSSAKEISPNWKMSNQEASSSLGFVLLVRTGCEREITRAHKKRRLKKTKSSKLTYRNHQWFVIHQV